MKIIILLVVLFLSQAQDLKVEDGVLILDDDNFEVAINKFKYIMVEFYADWCQPCMQFAPEYAQLASKIKEENIPVIIAKINGALNRVTGQRFEIQSYPEFKFFMNSVPLKYDGVRGLEQILEFIKETTGESLDELQTVNDIKQFQEEFPVAVIFFLESYKDRSLSVYNMVSKIFTDIAFGYTNSAQAMAKYKVRKNQIVLFKNFDEERNEFKGKITEKALIKFLDENAYPTFSEFDERAEERIFKRQKSALLLFWNESQESQKYKQLIQYIAPMIKKRVQVVAVNQRDGFLKSILERLGTSQVKFPDIFFYKTESGQKGETYRFKEDLSLDNVLRFMDHASFGKLERVYRSAEPPKFQEGLIFELVGDTFDDIVIKQGFDVLTIFYAPWDKEYKRVFPDILRLAQALEPNPNILIAQIDAVINEVPGVQIKQYPTFKFYRAVLPSVPIDFIQEFNYDRAINFIKAHTSFEWVEPINQEEKRNFDQETSDL